jgi:hypothetical protein
MVRREANEIGSKLQSDSGDTEIVQAMTVPA